MAFLHSKTGPDGKPKVDVFHQDLKSSNVLLYHDETLQLRGKISDFGLSVVRTKIVQHSQRGKSLAGKSFGGKTTNIMSAVDHKGGSKERIQKLSFLSIIIELTTFTTLLPHLL